ncbi:MAG: hypothetical protein J4215_05710 [Candidatus Diapherotrites archaeon]|uniref:Lycopene cyclase domain-containing protein n=1 Tax=Candidatus Iainarchaeum sp. TaxID=3101447 RepID=A0A8T4L5D4_9ARCH|nr:hypothetical protein [Candidatus Diapherotrites archaeon]
MAFEYFRYLAVIVGLVLLLVGYFKPRLHWGKTIVTALLSGSIFLALEYWVLNLGILQYNSIASSGFLIGGIPVEALLFFLTIPLLYAVFWQICKQKVTL